jgi:hypothetical protein
MSIADAILTQIRQAGQPRTVTSTETVTGKEPVDIGGLGLLLYMLMEMQPKGPNEPPMVGEGSPFGQLRGMDNLMPSFGAAAPSAGLGFGGMDPMQLITAILGATRSPGLGGF